MKRILVGKSDQEFTDFFAWAGVGYGGAGKNVEVNVVLGFRVL
ncbi:hypothetical protein N24_2961 [Corynebacterium suranareeae]|uniref:Uncharacterized protein n=1 Tax=Corynebacterium suranareeae TaxID=2506452 RepID=A0A161JCC3_9CORY|nr:hypothetical protein [Corynebacterium suranareeae]BAU97223.1 hypothetical protein N24_2961 [Corynebacterium suranareeae]